MTSSKDLNTFFGGLTIEFRSNFFIRFCIFSTDSFSIFIPWFVADGCNIHAACTLVNYYLSIVKKYFKLTLAALCVTISQEILYCTIVIYELEHDEIERVY